MAGDKEWITENLRSQRLSDGSEILQVTDDTEWSKLQSPAYCKAINTSDTYGLLYNWFTVQSGKLCPTGWHIGTWNEWYSLVYPFDRNLQGNMESNTAGCDLIKPDSTQLSGCLQFTSNKSGFSALIGSWRYEWGSFTADGKSSRFWLPEDLYPGSDFAFCIYVSCSCSSKQTSRTTGGKESGYSVRCVKD